MNKQQWLKTLKLAIMITLLLIVLELIFLIPGVSKFFENWLNSSHGWLLYVTIWLLMFLQGTVLNIPGVTILELCILAGVKVLSPTFLIISVSGTMVASITSYWFGRLFGAKAIKWIAGDKDEFNKWTKVINNKTKWWYFATVILPIFPDDLLCIVAGSLKFDFKFFCFANLFGKIVGTITMILTLNFIGIASSDIPVMLIVWLIGLIAEIIIFVILKRGDHDSKGRRNSIQK